MTSRVLRPTPLFPLKWALCLVIVFTAMISSAPIFARGASENDGVLVVGAVQFAISEAIYTGTDEFKIAVNSALDRMEEKAESEAPGRLLDLAVFPEYTSAFLVLNYIDAEERSALADDPAVIRQLNRTSIVQTIKDAEEETMSLWSEIAAERGYAILAGSTLAVGPNGGIRNRALLFDRNGLLQWTQDKCFPGGPETELLNLATGRVEDAESFMIDGRRIVTTICRDTYNDVWEEVLPAADLWIDIKANELPYTPEYYDEALAKRLPNSPIDRGLTVSLSGEILGFRFSGPTEYLYDIGPVAGTDPWEENAVLIVVYPPDRL